jgi:O-antigen/teichoic acid export membrane protein
MIESANLKRTAAKGLLWSALERFGAQGIQFVFSILITRILLPSDYGLVGMILIFIVIGQALVDSGFGMSLIWKKEPTPDDYSTVFYFNVLISFILYIFFFLIAPVIARFYNESQLVDLIRILCLNFIILSFGLIQQIILQKKVDFKSLTFINIFSSLLAGGISLYMAYKGYGVWSIVVQILTKSFFTTLLLWLFNQWRPTMVFSWPSFKELFSYGSKLAGAGLIYNVFQYFYFNVIGKLFPVDALGFYTRAVQLQEFAVKTIGSIFQRVAFPVFATIQNENDRLKNVVSKTLRTMSFFSFPVLIGLIAVADLLIEVVLTEKWLPASDYFKLLCLMGLFYSFHVVNSEVLKTKGKSNWVLKLEIIAKTIMVINIFITWRWGIKAIIIGQMVSVITSHLISSWYVRRLIGYSLWHQVKDVYIYFVMSVFMYIITVLVLYANYHKLTSLVLAIIFGAASYFSSAYIFKIEEIHEIKKLLKSIFIKIFKNG